MTCGRWACRSLPIGYERVPAARHRHQADKGNRIERNFRGHSSGVERLSSKQDAAGSNPAVRSSFAVQGRSRPVTQCLGSSAGRAVARKAARRMFEPSLRHQFPGLSGRMRISTGSPDPGEEGAWPLQDNRGNAAKGGKLTYRRPDLRIRGPARQAAAAAARRGFGFPGTGRDGWEGPERAWPSIREPGLPELRKGDGREARRHRDTLHVDHLSDVSPSGSASVRARQARAGAQSDRFRFRQARKRLCRGRDRKGRSIRLAGRKTCGVSYSVAQNVMERLGWHVAVGLRSSIGRATVCITVGSWFNSGRFEKRKDHPG